MSECENVDCSAGISLGCQTFCCRLLVRLDPDDQQNGMNEKTPQRFIEKGADGYCIHLDREKYLCRIWDQRSSTCRGYNCNSDFLLQVAVRYIFNNIAELARMAATAYIPKETYIQVPLFIPEKENAATEPR